MGARSRSSCPTRRSRTGARERGAELEAEWQEVRRVPAGAPRSRETRRRLDAAARRLGRRAGLHARGRPGDPRAGKVLQPFKPLVRADRWLSRSRRVHEDRVQRWGARLAPHRRAATCVRHPRARDGRDRNGMAPRRHPRRSARLSSCSPTTCGRRSGSRAQEDAGVFVWTHDSIGLGEDGPTHQPVEHLRRCARSRTSVDPPGRRERDRRGVAGRARARTTGPSRCPLAAEGPDARPQRVRPRRASSRARTCSGMPPGGAAILS